MRIAVALAGVLACVAADVWPIPAVLTTGNDTTAVLNVPAFAGNISSPILDDALARYSAIIAKEAFTPPADYKMKAPDTKGELSTLEVKVGSSDDSLSLETDESYTLDVPVSGKATLTARTVFGALRGLETFSQLVVSYNGAHVIRGTPVHIEDRPALAHRGLMLDTARNYYALADIKRTLDAMSYNKMNVFHWHIVDAQSWPVESKAYPELQSNGAYASSM
ncbi:Glucosamine-6-phosphate isomerase (Glucosamine-6-phosphate deaminase) (GNPDA) (GlcN6P deaminase), partial [Coemansia biformis]